MSMNLITRKNFETPNRNLAERKNNLRSVVEPYGYCLLLLKCTRIETTNKQMKKVKKKREALKATNWSMSQIPETIFETSKPNLIRWRNSISVQ